MIRLLFIVPYPELKEKVEYVLSRHPERKRLNADVQVMTVENTPDVPSDEYDAVIARGYTAHKTLSAYTQAPTISISISGYDILRAVSECCGHYHPRKIAVIGFSGQLYEVKHICRFFHTEAVIYDSVSHEDLSATMETALAAGCDAVIGGYSAAVLARQKGVPSIIIKTGEDALVRAVDEAILTVDQIRQERIVSQMYKTIIYASREGVLYVDAKGTIRVRNQAVRQMCGEVSLRNRPLRQALPCLWPVFHAVLQSGKEEDGRIVTIPGRKTTVSVRCTPVIANREMSGAVLSLSDVTVVQELEGRIRRTLSERGHQARYTFEDIIHRSAVIDRTIETARRYAASDSNVIIVGETGTGKELFAQSIHNCSSRRNGPFVAVNCAALTESLLESELFGYVEGAFTGTSRGGRMGLFEQAHGGTLFLDEIGEISLSTQTRLLRVLQERQVRRIGDNKVIHVNVRIISATNKSISRLAGRGLFRQDLVYRLDVLRLFLPPLRERKGDAELLFRHMLETYVRESRTSSVSLDPDALPLLSKYPFTGNVRELRNIAERVMALQDGGRITRQDLQEALYPKDLEEEGAPDPSPLPESIPAPNEPERLRRALEQCGGNKTKAARLLGMDRSTLWRRLKKYGM